MLNAYAIASLYSKKCVSIEWLVSMHLHLTQTHIRFAITHSKLPYPGRTITYICLIIPYFQL